jgi:glycosyltransferase involved in cell wall biosynthesis
MPRVSIIIPVHNGATTIRETIESALGQTFTDFELIVIDDGSSDSTLAILHEFHDPRVKVVAGAKSGLSSSRNRGLALAGGELIAFLDADDLWLPDKLKAQVAALDEHPDAGLAYVWTDYIDAAGRFMHPGQHACRAGWVLEPLLVGNFIETGSNPVVRRAAIDQCGSFDESLTAAEDWDLWLRVAMRYRFIAVPQALVLYRVHPSSMSSSDVLRQERTCLQVINRTFREASVPQNLLRQSLANLYTYLTYRALTPPFSRKSSGVALRFWCTAIRYRPSLLVHSPLTIITLAKILVTLTMPARIQRGLVEIVGSLRRPNAAIAAQPGRPPEEPSL